MPLYDTTAVLGEPALAGVRLENGGVCLLHLEEQRIVGIATEHQDDPRARADAAHANHLACHVDEAVAVDESRPRPGHRAPVSVQVFTHLALEVAAADVLEELPDGDDERRVVDDPQGPVDVLGQTREGAHAVLRPGLAGSAVEPLLLPPSPHGFESREHVSLVEPRVPDIDRTSVRERMHRLAVAAGRRAHRRAPVARPKPAVPARDLDACRKPLDVPLERAGQRFVEVVDVENQAAVRRSEASEVREVGVPAELHTKSRRGHEREVRCHHSRSAPVERESRFAHALVPDRE